MPDRACLQWSIWLDHMSQSHSFSAFKPGKLQYRYLKKTTPFSINSSMIDPPDAEWEGWILSNDG